MKQLNENELVRDVEATIIGTLQVYPELFKCVFIEPCYFGEVYKPIFGAMLQSMQDNKSLISEQILKTYGVDANLYLACSDLGMHKNKKEFNRLQDFLLEKYKLKQTIWLNKELEKGNIDLLDHSKKYNKLMSMNANKSEKLTVENLLHSLKDTKNNIWFSRFAKFGALANITEHDFVILAAGTGVGKTGVALNFVNDLSKYYKILYFNMEMPESRIKQRLISLASEITMKDVKKYAKLDPTAMDKVNVVINNYAQRNITIISESQTIDSIRSFIASNETDKNTIVFLDHIGLIGSKAKNSYERMTEVAKELRKISMDYNCTLFALCQLNRDLKNSKKPQLSLLRDSGEIEQSARKVVFVWQDENDYSLVIEKNDEGSCSYVNIIYDKETQSVYESARIV